MSNEELLQKTTFEIDKARNSVLWVLFLLGADLSGGLWWGAWWAGNALWAFRVLMVVRAQDEKAANQSHE